MDDSSQVLKSRPLGQQVAKQIPASVPFVAMDVGMSALALTRKVGETIVVGDNIKISVAKIIGNKVMLVINAPRSTPVHRGEVSDRNATRFGGRVQ